MIFCNNRQLVVFPKSKSRPSLHRGVPRLANLSLGKYIIASCACTKLAGIHSSKSQIKKCHQFCTLKRSIISYEWCNMMCTFVPTIGSFLSPHGSAGTFAACGYAGTNGKGRLQTSEDGRLLGPGCAN